MFPALLKKNGCFETYKYRDNTTKSLDALENEYALYFKRTLWPH